MYPLWPEETVRPMNFDLTTGEWTVVRSMKSNPCCSQLFMILCKFLHLVLAVRRQWRRRRRRGRWSTETRMIVMLCHPQIDRNLFKHSQVGVSQFRDHLRSARRSAATGAQASTSTAEGRCSQQHVRRIRAPEAGGGEGLGGEGGGLEEGQQNTVTEEVDAVLVDIPLAAQFLSCRRPPILNKREPPAQPMRWVRDGRTEDGEMRTERRRE